MSGRAWIPSDEKILQEWLGKLPEGNVSREHMREICEKLNRSDHAIYSKIRRMTLYTPQKVISEPLIAQAGTGVLEAEVARLKHQVEELTSYRKIPTRAFEGEWIKMGVVSDTHMGSLYERLDLLNGAYDVFEQQNIHYLPQLHI